jgi:sterol desaturase/sphingolipid hydroxylase (fatty acid hydroxylase superfamily)
MKLEPKPAKRLKVGEGYISGYLSILFGLVSLGAVFCFLFPEYLTTPEFRVHYPIDLFRKLLLVCIIAAYAFSAVSFVLSNRPRLALIGACLSTIAILLGGAGIEVKDFDQSVGTLSLDWLVLDIVALSVLFIPLELFAPQRPEQTKFHPEWRTDAIYFAISHLAVQYTAVLIILPAETLFGNAGLEGLHTQVSSWPFAVQLFSAMFLADIFQYTAHRFFHANPVMWRFHAVHHSIKTMDWVAGSRLHLVDVLITRAFSYLPLYAMGFSIEVFYTYVAIVAIQAVSAHANISIPFGPLKYLLVTPQFHHWHHSEDPAHYNKNFAIHFPFIDRLFGTYYLPENEWPKSVGLGKQEVPKGYLRQFFYPFTRR